MLDTKILPPLFSDVKTVINRPGFRLRCYHPLEGTPSYRYHVGSLSAAVWFSLDRNCWIVRNADLDIRLTFPADTAHDALERVIVATLTDLLADDGLDFCAEAYGL